MADVRIRERVGRPVERFTDRRAAGRALRDYVDPAPDPDAFVFAVPRGGVPVARPLADALGCPLLPLPVRKLHIPSNPEMGFGAITLDGTTTLNRPVMAAFGIDDRTALAVITEVHAELQRRAEAYSGSWPLPDLAGRRTWLIDDGLATGYSTIAAARMLRTREPSTITLGVPVAPEGSLALLEPYVDVEWCLCAQRPGGFAVASFYGDFHDLTDDEVRVLLDAG